MSLFSTVDSGSKQFRSRFTKSISYNIQMDMQFGRLYPVMRKFVLPGDVWRVGGQCLVRLQPLQSPPMNRMKLKVRYFFVPLRLVEPDCELIITGSNDGHMYESTLPKFDNLFAKADTNVDADCYKIKKHSFWDYMGCQIGDYATIKNDSCLPAAYWRKGFDRIYWDYFDDENIGYYHANYADFDAFEADVQKLGGASGCGTVSLPKDYFTSALPWQLKAPGGIAPAIAVTGNATFTPSYNQGWISVWNADDPNLDTKLRMDTTGTGDHPFGFITTGTEAIDIEKADEFDHRMNTSLNQTQSVSITGLGIYPDEFRAAMAENRIYERLARCGSRYTEYLRSNFGIAPADDTLQRSQYLGGWSLPIVTTEVLQTAADGSTPVGTMRGHGITNGGNSIRTFFAKEFGMIFGLATVLPEIKYTTGMPKELSYKERFDFFNPSFQHLSEQEVKNGELYMGLDGKNEDTFGFQAYANELRTSQNIVVGDMRDSLSSWNQALHYSSRPNLNSGFISASNYAANFNQCFAVTSADAYPIILDFQNILDVYRPMVRYSTPGLVDHL